MINNYYKSLSSLRNSDKYIVIIKKKTSKLTEPFFFRDTSHVVRAMNSLNSSYLL